MARRSKTRDDEARVVSGVPCCSLLSVSRGAGVKYRGSESAEITMRRCASVGGLKEESSTKTYRGGRGGGSAGAKTGAAGVGDDEEDADDGREHRTRNVESESSKVFRAWVKSPTRFEGIRAIGEARFTSR